MKTCAIVGGGYRGLFMFGQRLMSDAYKDTIRLTAVCDKNIIRAEYFSRECGGLAVYTDFDLMLAEMKPDTVIVTTPDATHDEFIVRALDFGCEVISEKPMTINASKAARIQAAERRSGKPIKVVFNMRYMPLQQKIKEIIASDAIGKIHSVNLEWYMDTIHGADYFRRWHRRMENSGGLLIHKSTHHFDLINWWLSDTPEQVYAAGNLAVYGPTRAERGVRCLTCPYKDTCEFYWDIQENPVYEQMYLDAESEDGYVRDSCVFSGEIDIYDTMNVQVKYTGGALLNYSLVAYSPYEGWHLSITGSKGRLEVNEFITGPQAGEDHNKIMVHRNGSEQEIVTVPKRGGSHGGGDDLLLADMVGTPRQNHLGQQASSNDGVYSLIIGAAANESIRTEKLIRVEELLQEQQI